MEEPSHIVSVGGIAILKRAYSSPVNNDSTDLPNSRLIARDLPPEFVGFCILG